MAIFDQAQEREIRRIAGEQARQLAQATEQRRGRVRGPAAAAEGLTCLPTSPEGTLLVDKTRAASVLGVKPRMLRSLERSGLLQRTKVGDLTRYAWDDLERCVRRLRGEEIE